MDLTHRFTVPAPIDEAWAAFNDLERIAPCFPGASLTSYDGEAFEGLVKVKLGPISLQYTGSGRFVERDETARRAIIEAKGRDKRGNGTAAANVTAELASAGDDATDVMVVTNLSITGKPAQFGRGVMQDVSDKLLAQFASCLESKLGESAEPAVAAGGTAESAPAPDQPEEGPSTEPAAGASFGADEAAAAPGATTPASRAGGAPTSTPAAAIDLGATVLPVLLKRYAAPLAGVLLALLVLRALLRRRR
jgi:carbon monoxide dehydrogenase subunit G